MLAICWQRLLVLHSLLFSNTREMGWTSSVQDSWPIIYIKLFSRKILENCDDHLVYTADDDI